MKSVQILSVFGLVAAAQAFNQIPRGLGYNATTVVTETVATLTTFCPVATVRSCSSPSRHAPDVSGSMS
jgi:hypothetical protein